jgi:hypothetical protein
MSSVKKATGAVSSKGGVFGESHIEEIAKNIIWRFLLSYLSTLKFHLHVTRV